MDWRLNLSWGGWRKWGKKNIKEEGKKIEVDNELCECVYIGGQVEKC